MKKLFKYLGIGIGAILGICAILIAFNLEKATRLYNVLLSLMRI